MVKVTREMAWLNFFLGNLKTDEWLFTNHSGFKVLHLELASKIWWDNFTCEKIATMTQNETLLAQWRGVRDVGGAGGSLEPYLKFLSYGNRTDFMRDVKNSLIENRVLTFEEIMKNEKGLEPDPNFLWEFCND